MRSYGYELGVVAVQRELRREQDLCQKFNVQLSADQGNNGWLARRREVADNTPPRAVDGKSGAIANESA